MLSPHTHAKPYQYLIYFVTAFIACYLVQEILLNRLTSIGTGYITGGTFIYFTSPLIIDVVAEVYGYKIAKQLIWCGLFSLLFMALCVAICLKMPYPVFWSTIDAAYYTALESVSRTAIVSSIAVFIGQLINAYLISKWRILVQGKYFWLRCLGSSVIGDSATVILTTLGTFMGRIPAGMFTGNLIPELVIMVIFTSIGAVPAVFLANFLKKAEGLSNHDFGVNFNPFKLDEKN
jgi:queuosine precursor transporter